MGEMLGSRHHHGRGEPVAVATAQNGRLEQGVVPHQREKRLGLVNAAAWPQPGAGTAAKDDWSDLAHANPDASEI